MHKADESVDWSRLLVEALGKPNPVWTLMRSGGGHRVTPLAATINWLYMPPGSPAQAPAQPATVYPILPPIDDEVFSLINDGDAPPTYVEEVLCRLPYSSLRRIEDYIADGRKMLMMRTAWPRCRKCQTDKEIAIRFESLKDGREEVVLLLDCAC